MLKNLRNASRIFCCQGAVNYWKILNFLGSSGYTVSEGGTLSLPVGPEAAPSLMYPVDPKKENAKLIQSAAMSAKNYLLMSQFFKEFFALKKSTEMSLGAPASYNLPNPLTSSHSSTEQGDTRDAARFGVCFPSGLNTLSSKENLPSNLAQGSPPPPPRLHSATPSPSAGWPQDHPQIFMRVHNWEITF
jgi:hypothetical protein